jgi:tetratricopeptide (TPR) repeat protein
MLIQWQPAWQMITAGLASAGPLRVKNRMSQKTFPGRMSILGRTLPVWQGGLIVLLVFLAYLPALHGGFVWDDDSWTTNLSPLFQDTVGLRLIWFQPTVLQQYYPLSGTTFWLDYQLWKFWTPPYHVENILLHSLAALLFWRLLLRLQLPGAWLAAAIFALHPVMVESVAWITERKNLLSLALYLGALLAYGQYARYAQRVTGDTCQVTEPEKVILASALSRGTRYPSLFYGLAFVLFLGALLAKATAFSLPAAILLIGWWQRGQIRWRADVLPTLPFFALSIGLCAVTAWLEKNHVGAQGPDFALTFPQRCLIAGHAFWFYLGKLFWPAKLCFVYPRWQPNPGSGWQWLYPVTAIGTLFTLWLVRWRIGRGPVTALFFFVGTLFPVLGFMNAYGMRYSFVWDHWVYLSALGIIALVVAVVVRAAEWLRTPAVVYGFGAIALPLLALLTWRQCGMYTDMATLWQTTLARNPSCWMAHSNWGKLLDDQGRIGEAMEHYRTAIQINPNSYDALNNLGAALLHQGRIDEAIENYHKAIQINPDCYFALNGLGAALAAKGRFDEAIKNYYRAIQINPIYSDALNNLGAALAAKGRFDEAIKNYRKAIQIKPNYCEALDNLGIALTAKGQFDEAIENYRQSIQVNSNQPETIFHLGTTLGQLGRTREAVAQYREALRLNPDLAVALNNLAWVLAASPDDELRNGAEAVRLAEHACKLTHYGEPLFIGTLAAAYAECGRFPEAVTTAEKAEQLAASAGLSAVAAKNRRLLELYRAGKPYHEPAPTGQ